MNTDYHTTIRTRLTSVTILLVLDAVLAGWFVFLTDQLPADQGGWDLGMVIAGTLVAGWVWWRYLSTFCLFAQINADSLTWRSFLLSGKVDMAKLHLSSISLSHRTLRVVVGEHTHLYFTAGAWNSDQRLVFQHFITDLTKHLE